MRTTRTPFLSAFLLFCVIGPATAATVAVVLSDDTAPYQEAADGLEARLPQEHTVIRIQASKVGQSESALVNARLIVSVGVEATRRIGERRGRAPILAILIPRAWYESQGRAALSDGGRLSGAIFIDQPLNRQFRLIKSALPSVRNVGVVMGGQAAGRLPELERLAKAHQLTLVSAIVDSSRRLVETLGGILQDAELLLLPFPDQEVLTRTSAQSIFMTSYRYRDPVVGYSLALSRAGALLAVYSTPTQIGQQAGEVLERSLAGDALPDALWPKYFSVSVNTYVGRSLGISVPPESVLLKMVKDAETHGHD